MESTKATYFNVINGSTKSLNNTNKDISGLDTSDLQARIKKNSAEIDQCMEELNEFFKLKNPQKP